MKTFKPLLCAFFSIVSMTFLSSETFAQDKVRLPAGLSPSSSVSEIVDWLDKNSFAYARIGVNNSGYSSPVGSFQKVHYSRLTVDYIFSQGFRLANADGCNLRLRNEGARLINGDGASQSVELVLPLARMSDKKGRAPYRHTTNLQKATLFGTWRTEFLEKGFFRHGIFQVRLNASSSEQRAWELGERLKFTFDDKKAADEFNAAFRQAIKLCNAK